MKEGWDLNCIFCTISYFFVQSGISYSNRLQICLCTHYGRKWAMLVKCKQPLNALEFFLSKINVFQCQNVSLSAVIIVLFHLMYNFNEKLKI